MSESSPSFLDWQTKSARSSRPASQEQQRPYLCSSLLMSRCSLVSLKPGTCSVEGTTAVAVAVAVQ